MKQSDIKNNPHLNKLLEDSEKTKVDKTLYIIDNIDDLEHLFIIENGFSIVKTHMIDHINPFNTNLVIEGKIIDCKAIFDIFHSSKKEDKNIYFEMNPHFCGQFMFDPLSVQIEKENRYVPSTYFLKYKFSIDLLFNVNKFEECFNKIIDEREIKTFLINDLSKLDKIVLNHNGFYVHDDGLEYHLNPRLCEIQIENYPVINCNKIYDEYIKIDPVYKSPIVFKGNDLNTGSAIFVKPLYPKKEDNPNESFWHGAILSLSNLWDMDNFKFIYAHELGHLHFRLTPHSFFDKKIFSFIKYSSKSIFLLIYAFYLYFIYQIVHCVLHTDIFQGFRGFVLLSFMFLISMLIHAIAIHVKDNKLSFKITCHYIEFWCDSWAYEAINRDVDRSKLFMNVTDYKDSQSHPSSYRRILNLNKDKDKRNNPFKIQEFWFLPKKYNDKINELMNE